VKQNRKAFTLFELMIVVLIIGIVYALVLGRLDPKQHMKIASLKALRDTMTAKHHEGQRLDLYIYGKCDKAALFVNGEYREKMHVDLAVSLFENLEVYKSDPFGHERKINFVPVRIEDKLEPVCFRYTVFPNGSASNYIVHQIKKDRYIVFPPYFEDVNETDSLEEALALFTHEKEKKITFHE